jgi:molybdopterin-containing oxidoreductase family iron-sulfur binding subunit
MSDAPNAPTLQEIRDRLQNTKGRAFWRGLDEVADTDAFQAFMAEEFPRQAAPLEASLKRRDFLKLLGASLALAGLSACARPPLPHEKIVPYVRQPEELVPGRPLFYATAITDGGYAEGLLAESHQGRPTKVEGNPDHPASLGATSAVTQATILTLYDPDRSRYISQNGERSSLDELLQQLEQKRLNWADNNGRGLHILTPPLGSPSLAAQLQALLQR